MNKNNKNNENLVAKIQQGLRAEELLQGDGHDPRRRWELEQMIAEGRNAMHSLVTANRRLVLHVAHRYTDAGLPLDDLVQAGFIGLIRAAATFDFGRGTRFSTYAVWRIRQAIARTVANESRSIRIPVRAHDTLVKMTRLYSNLTVLHGHPPSDEEIADALGVPLEHVRRLKHYISPPVSLDAPLFGEEDLTLSDTIDNPATDPEEEALTRINHENLRSLVNQLPSRLAQIVILRYGLDCGEGRSLREVARLLGISSERVRQLERRALTLLRKKRGRQILAPC